MTTKQLNLRQKLAVIQNEVRGLGKNADQRTYQYVTESKVLEHIKPRMAELGLLLNTEVTDVANQRIDYATNSGSVKSAMFTRVKMRFTWIDCDSDETLVSEWAGIGMNDWDKGFGSAITYGHRYYLLKFFHIATDADDVDALTDEAHTEDTAAVTPPTPPAPQVNAYTAVKEAIYKDLQQITDPAQIKPFYLANKTRLNPEDVDGLKIACELHSKSLTKSK